MRVRGELPLSFIEDGNIILCVPSSARDCDVLLSVHRSTLLRQSPIFDDMLSIPATTSEIYDGRPLVHLRDSAEDWMKLLRIFYEPLSSKLKSRDHDTLLLADDLLTLASKYQMEIIRNQLVR